ncbi:flagellar assembly protein FliX [Acetobacteraceae bacterium KSS12]|uniref:Flagellar assembly protein FliX n=2 Tax=Rhizosaccharibacter radicis TaxID=2782605 RepID=A0ABT1W018_9PROT|nr:flagellar assembly protein FliX [Acetobacteraceae bacterium KSS12]
MPGGTASTPAGAGIWGARSAAVPASALTMLSLQEVDPDPEQQNREGRQRAQELLDMLADLQRAVLASDGAPAEILASRLAALGNAEIEVADPTLRLLLRSVRLRAKVEAARLEARGSINKMRGCSAHGTP